ncbi:efflux RND transporter periplasmic adaptor subunit [Sulfurimonas sp. C5]|uniref:efflux RND transporter periplasmic adaptor subunit n=1 Tax=Sulfurimonas sp. C5 TaxID=3036947 RepID=UPI002458C96F|nr:efflux RND transporter periplasmic adaptor subunit [Sulfurimonas sp. C5]MDH4944297.1 efflux RND transporter periplasmic adaptor subunit [Sulfurimonas sp. C5]
MSIFKQILVLLTFVTLLNAGENVTQLFSVQTVKVQKMDVAKSFKSYGYVKADEANIYMIMPRFSGFVEKIYVDAIYSYVQKGQALAAIYSPEVYKAKEDYLNSYYYTKRNNTNGMLKSARTKLELLGISNKEIEDVIKNKKVSKLTTIYTPKNGYLFAKTIVDGSAFKAGNMLYKIINTDSLWIEAKLFDTQLASIKNTQSFEVTTATTDTPLVTNKKVLYPDVDPKAAAYTLRLIVNDPTHKLILGQYATLKGIDIKKQYLVLPKTAVIRKNGKFYVFMVGEYEGEYEPLQIMAKLLDTEHYIITEGLNEGDEVVNNALFMMDSDAQINGLY